ncbi:secretoglobin family 2B member 2 [Dromiciops gliroides]|uniref:secretoglobin family 2B member 2 n=1 Tax=Dromiciops gliroides TaxID=33562 RepID=UPI001CC53ED8|nr:secretoglobin family 2B member 2 [Dromiciops gliroides]
MKVTVAAFSLLLVLALSSQYVEGCLSFYGTFGILLTRSPWLLESNLKKYNPSKTEIEAFKKIQECYKENSLKSSLQDVALMMGITLSPECLRNIIPNGIFVKHE